MGLETGPSVIARSLLAKSYVATTIGRRTEESCFVSVWVVGVSRTDHTSLGVLRVFCGGLGPRLL